MISYKIKKGLKSAPILFGIRGLYIFPFITVFLLSLLILMALLVSLFFDKRWGESILVFFFWFFITFLIYSIFKKASESKPFKKMPKHPDFISNFDLVRKIK